MSRGPELRTERLLLRRWQERDLEPFAALNADREVMRYFPRTLSRADSDAGVQRMEYAFDERGYGLWAVEVLADGSFAGLVGLNLVQGNVPCAGSVEVGWRLARTHWGRGYATEAARACLDFGFDTVGLDEIVAYTAAINAPSRAVMERLGMRHDPASDFEHPDIPAGPLRAHVLYRIRRS